MASSKVMGFVSGIVVAVLYLLLSLLGAVLSISIFATTVMSMLPITGIITLIVSLLSCVLGPLLNIFFGAVGGFIVVKTSKNYSYKDIIIMALTAAVIILICNFLVIVSLPYIIPYLLAIVNGKTLNTVLPMQNYTIEGYDVFFTLLASFIGFLYTSITFFIGGIIPIVLSKNRTSGEKPVEEKKQV